MTETLTTNPVSQNAKALLFFLGGKRAFEQIDGEQRAVVVRDLAAEIDRLTEALAGAYASVNLLTEMHEKAVAEVAELRRARDAWLQVWDNVKLDNPNLREDNKPLAVAACYGLMKLEMDRMREALVMSVNAMREPFDGWKGEVEALALAAARAALGEQP